MTREEAIERMKIIKGDCYIIDNPKDKEAFDMSIFALEQEPYELLIIKSDILQHQEDRKKWIESIKREKENGVIILPPYFTPLLVPNDVEIRIEQPCDDAISRILKKMWNCRGEHTTSIDKVAMEQIIRDELPSVTQKSGKWIEDEYGNVICSGCKRFRRDCRYGHTNYCNHCGARMYEPQESEDKK